MLHKNPDPARTREERQHLLGVHALLPVLIQLLKEERGCIASSESLVKLTASAGPRAG